MEKYFNERTEAKFTHGLCPTCIERLYPDLAIPRKPEDDYKM